MPKDLDTATEKRKSQLCFFDNITIPRCHYFTTFQIQNFFAYPSTLTYRAVAHYRIISDYNIKVSLIT